MVLCIKCFTREQQFTVIKKEIIKKDHKHPRDAKIIVCSRCIQKGMEKTENEGE